MKTIPFRTQYLTLILGSVLVVLGKVILFPLPENPKPSSFVFPEQIPLPEWQSDEVQPLAKSEDSLLIAQKRYRYIRNNLPLDIEMRYMQLPGGDFMTYLREHKPASSTVVRQREGVGFYILGVDKQQQAYLSTCINPRGGTTLTFAQFNQNRYFYDLRPERLVSWFLGKEELLDRRCLWAHLSIPVKDSSPTKAFQVLEEAWLSWHQWWQPRFPKF